MPMPHLESGKPDWPKFFAGDDEVTYEAFVSASSSSTCPLGCYHSQFADEDGGLNDLCPTELAGLSISFMEAASKYNKPEMRRSHDQIRDYKVKGG